MSPDRNAQSQSKRRSHPLTPTQERLFFGVLFVIAVLIQIGAVWTQAIAH